MDYDEIKMKIIDGKLLPMIDWVNEQLSNDPQVQDNKCKEKSMLYKFMLDIKEQFIEFVAEESDDDRNNQDDEIFGDNDIAVGPGRQTATDFMDPPEDDDGGDPYLKGLLGDDDEDTDDGGLADGFDSPGDNDDDEGFGGF